MSTYFSFQITVAFDETTTLEDVDKLFKVFSSGKPVSVVITFTRPWKILGLCN